MFETLFPVIVPRSYFRLGNWPGSYLCLRHPDLAMTWVEFSSRNWMDYVSADRQREIEGSGFDVHATAMANLRRESQPLATHEKIIGGRTIFQAMMHADGLGSSRLLLLAELNQSFPEGYWLAVPERSCGMVVPKNVLSHEREEALLTVSKCFQGGTVQMLPGLHEPSMFEIADS